MNDAKKSKSIKVLAIDPGFRQVGFVVGEIDPTTYQTKIIYMFVKDLTHTTYNRRKHNAEYLANSVLSWLLYTAPEAVQKGNFDVLLIETQMKAVLKTQEYALHGFYWGSVSDVLHLHPLRYKNDRGGHHKNKITSAQWLKTNYPEVDAEITKEGRSHDIADCLRMIDYYKMSLPEYSVFLNKQYKTTTRKQLRPKRYSPKQTQLFSKVGKIEEIKEDGCETALINRWRDDFGSVPMVYDKTPWRELDQTPD